MLLYWAAIAACLPVFWVVVLPSLGGGAQRLHASHWLLVLLHALSGSVTIIAGFTALWMGWTRRAFEWHRHTGCTYIGAGMTMAFLALVLSIENPHASPGSVLSTGTLSLVWLVAAGIGWRRGSQRRWASHRRWMIRSMVLTWTFVFCRLASRAVDLDAIGPSGAALGIWTYWLGPALICEAVLQWWQRWRPA